MGSDYGKNCNLLVAAAAGAGKTAVIVERIVRKVTEDVDPVDIDKLLVVTSPCGGNRMRERIAEAISAALERTGILEGSKQLTLLNKRHHNIHSFCLEVIRNHFK